MTPIEEESEPIYIEIIANPVSDDDDEDCEFNGKRARMVKGKGIGKKSKKQKVNRRNSSLKHKSVRWA